MNFLSSPNVLQATPVPTWGYNSGFRQCCFYYFTGTQMRQPFDATFTCKLQLFSKIKCPIYCSIHVFLRHLTLIRLLQFLAGSYLFFFHLFDMAVGQAPSFPCHGVTWGFSGWSPLPSSSTPTGWIKRQKVVPGDERPLCVRNSYCLLPSNLTWHRQMSVLQTGEMRHRVVKYLPFVTSQN